MKRLTSIIGLIITIITFPFEKKVVKIQSKAMNKEIKVTVITPENYTTEKKYSVIYGLHGWGGSYKSFGRARSIGKLADKYNIIYVFPDGNWNSWYIDSEINKKSKYMTFISKELVSYIDNNYSTYKNKYNRAITGFSMGGFGALYNGLNNLEIFGNIGSISGGVNPEKFQNKWGIKKVINNNWDNYNIISIIEKRDILEKLELTNKIYEKNNFHSSNDNDNETKYFYKKEKNNKTNIIIDVGNKDFFLNTNNELHQKMENLGIEHTYTVRKGRHNKKYWEKSLEIQTKFFMDIFIFNQNFK